LIAVNPGEAVLRVAGFEEPFDDTFLDRTAEPATAFRSGACRVAH